MTNLKQRIEGITGNDGYWKKSTGDALKEVAKALMRQGISEDAAVAYLYKIYWAVAAEFGYD